MNKKRLHGFSVSFNKTEKKPLFHKLTALLTITLLAVCLTGCGRDKELEAYKENVTTFIDNVSALHDNMNNIDVASETRVADFLFYMDALDAEFTSFAELEVPKQFASIETLADDAGMYMSEAVSLYHQAFEADVLDAALLDAASENYERANKRIEYIASILRGNIPEDASVTVEYADEDLNEE